MAASTKVKGLINRFLEPFDLRIETLTATRREGERLRQIQRRGYFENPVYPLPPAFERMDPLGLLASLEQFRGRFESFRGAADNPVGYAFANDYFTSPDAEVLYALVRTLRPARILEVGSGFSTQVSRLAIQDGGFESRLVCIDPEPRRDVMPLADELIHERVERVDRSLLIGLEEGDILFVDSSHRLAAGNDVEFLLLEVLPALRPGVVIHVHDVFLPYAYPRSWVVEERRGYTEQHLVQAILQFSDVFEVLWAGYFLQRTRSDLGRFFPHWAGRDAKSLWLRKRR